MSEFNPVSQPSSASDADEIVKLDQGKEIQDLKPFGIGIDVHSKFIQVCVLVKNNLRIFEYNNEFTTDWYGLLKGKRWAKAVVQNCTSPKVDLSDESTTPFHYCCESTSCYHIPLLDAWEGEPSVVNPSIVKAGKRKTDRIDAKQLGMNDLAGTWPSFYVAIRPVREVRMILASVQEHRQTATRISNRINNELLKFGYTVGRSGSVTKNRIVRAIVENQISDHPDSDIGNLCPLGIPDDVREIFRNQYEEYDYHQEMANYYEKQLVDKVKSLEWETRDKKISGSDMIRILTTAPGVGEMTAVVWLAHIITPNRFPNSKAVAAYCGLDPSLKISAAKVVSTVRRGGNKQLHSYLCMCASILIKNHNEMFGKWGYNLYLQTSRWKKATNAVARKLAVSLYYMSSNCCEFSYEKYNLIKDTVIVDIAIEKLAELDHDFNRYIKPLRAVGVLTTSDLIHKYFSCELRSVKGLGKKFFGIVKEFVNNQKNFKLMLEQEG